MESNRALQADKAKSWSLPAVPLTWRKYWAALTEALLQPYSPENSAHRGWFTASLSLNTLINVRAPDPFQRSHPHLRSGADAAVASHLTDIKHPNPSLCTLPGLMLPQACSWLLCPDGAELSPVKPVLPTLFSQGWDGDLLPHKARTLQRALVAALQPLPCVPTI